MREIDVAEPTEEWWDKWRGECKTATKQFIRKVESGEVIDIDENLYKRHKYNFLMAPDGPFRGKCAYCERDLSSQHGDVEHFRPKKGPTDEEDRPVSKTAGGTDEKHPGYYWLVYDWRNLLPSCQICNVGNRIMSSGDKPGKRNRFPLADEAARAWKPGTEGEESPLLLNPTVDDIKSHLTFDPSGMISWCSERGEMTVRLLGLNDYGMPGKRTLKYKEVKRLVTDYILKGIGNHLNAKEQVEIDHIKKGYGDYTSFARLAIDDAIKESKDRFQNTLDQLGDLCDEQSG